MGIPAIKNRVGMSVSGTPGTGTITLGSAESGYQSFATAYGANANVDILIEDGTAWEIARDCTYTHSGTTVTRGTLEASSTGSAISLTSSAKVYVVESATRIYPHTLAGRGYIDGGQIAYSSTTAITVSACRVNINGVIRETTSTTTLTSGTTMKDLANSTVTIGASKCYFVFAYNNAGTLEFRVEDRDTTGDGADPTWDSALDYWKAASTGAEARRIGKFWTNGSSQILEFYPVTTGRYRGFQCANYAAVALVSAGTSTTYASITITPYWTADDSEMIVQMTTVVGSAAGANIYISINSGTNDTAQGSNAAAVASQSITAPAIVIPYTGTLHYKTIANNSAYVRATGARFLV